MEVPKRRHASLKTYSKHVNKPPDKGVVKKRRVERVTTAVLSGLDASQQISSTRRPITEQRAPELSEKPRDTELQPEHVPELPTLPLPEPSTTKTTHLQPISQHLPSKKRRVEEQLIPSSSPPSKKIKRSTIQNYFKPIQTSSSSPNISVRSLATTAGDIPSRTPPSSPPSSPCISHKYFAPKRRPRRRLTTKPKLQPLNNMSSRGNFFDEADSEPLDLTEVVGDMGDERMAMAEQYQNLQDQRDADEMERIANEPFPPYGFSSGRNRSRTDAVGVAQSRGASDVRNARATSDAFPRTVPPARSERGSVSDISIGLHDPINIESGWVKSGAIPRQPAGSPSASGSSGQSKSKSNKTRASGTLPGSSGSGQSSNDTSGQNMYANRPAPPHHDTSFEFREHMHDEYKTDPTFPFDEARSVPPQQGFLGSSTPSPPPRPRPRRPTMASLPGQSQAPNQSYTQTHFDFGPPIMKECKDCGMNYNTTSIADNKSHDAFHEEIMSGKKRRYTIDTLLIMKKVVMGEEHWIQALHAEAPSKYWKEIAIEALSVSCRYMAGWLPAIAELTSEVKNMNDVSAPEKRSGKNGKELRFKIYTYHIGTKLVGVLLVQRVSWGLPYISSAFSSPTTSRTNILDPSSTSHSTISTPAHRNRIPILLSVARIWVRPSHQLSRIATQLLDNAREDFFTSSGLDIVVKKKYVAFSQPTEDGKAFAKKYMKGVWDREGVVKTAFLVACDADGGDGSVEGSRKLGEGEEEYVLRSEGGGGK